MLGLQVIGLYRAAPASWEGDTATQRWGDGLDPSTLDQDPVDAWVGNTERALSLFPVSPRALSPPHNKAGCQLWVQCNGAPHLCCAGGTLRR